MSKELEVLEEIIIELCHYRNTDENAICKDKITREIKIDFNKQAECNNKLGQLEDIEEELGIELTILFKALNQGVFLENGKRVEHHAVFLCKCDGKWALGYQYSTKYGLQGWILETENYKKRWALSKEELL